MSHNFCHLHTHSMASMLDASATIKKLVKRAKELEMPAIALTDHGVVYGAMEFYREAQNAGIKPILGIESDLVEDCAESRGVGSRQTFHIILLAENEVGWRNITQLVSLSNQDPNYYYKPRVDFGLLEQYTEGVIVLSGCSGGAVAHHLQEQRDEEGEVIVRSNIYKGEAFVRRFLKFLDKEHFYIEVQPHNDPAVNQQLRKIALKYGLSTVATNDVHYVNEEDYHAHQALKSISSFLYSKASFSDFEEPAFYLRTAEQMSGVEPAELERTLHIAERCNVEIDFDCHRLPFYPFVPEGQDHHAFLTELVKEGLRQKKLTTSEYAARAKRELADIESMGFTDYFLIVWDVVKWTKGQGILTGPGRGSVGGSITSYALDITGIDPLKYNLIWERFLNKGRKGLPDIDTDVPRSRRGEVIQYIKERFGEDRVTQISTFGSLGARAVLKDVFRIYDLPFDEANRITGLVPLKNADHAIPTLSEALEASPALRECEKKHKAWFQIARALEGCHKSLGTHASAVVIADKSFEEGGYPLCRNADGQPAFAWDMKTVDSLNLLKHDILGLKTLDVLSDTLALIKQRHGVDINIEALPLDDEATFDLLIRGRTKAVFQLESQLGRLWCSKVKPRSIEAIADTVSVIRPGSLDSGLAEQYDEVKRGLIDPEYAHPDLEPILGPTYGTILFQEQVIEICKQIAGMDAAESDDVRRAMSKKIVKELQAKYGDFIEGCEQNGYSESDADAIWELIKHQAGYSFNKCFHYKTKILLPDGSQKTIKQLFQEEYRGPVCSINPRTSQYQESVVDHIKWSGSMKTFRLTLANNDSVVVSRGHKFITSEGIRQLCQIEVGDYIAMPQRIVIKPSYDFTTEQAQFFGCLIAEGNLCHPSALYFSSAVEEEREYFAELSGHFENTVAVQDIDDQNVHTKRIDKSSPQGAYEFCKRLGMLWKRAPHKFVPQEIKLASDEVIAAFLGAAWTGDGSAKDSVSYSTSSRKLAEDIKFLCLRLGIVTSTQRRDLSECYEYKTAKRLNDKERALYLVTIIGRKSWNNFIKYVSPWLFGEKLNDFNNKVARGGDHKFSGIYDGLPRNFIHQVRQEILMSNYEFKAICDLAGISPRVLYDNKQKSISYWWLERLNKVLKSDLIDELINSDYAWMPVRSIEYKSRADIYDITVRDTHTLIADNVLAMNSHAVGYAIIAYWTAYFKANYPLEFFCARLRYADNLDETKEIIYDAKIFEIDIVPPRLSHGNVIFDVTKDNKIAFGLSSLRGVGAKAIKSLLSSNTSFKDFDDFLTYAVNRRINKQVVEALIKSGALDDLDLSRTQMLARYTLFTTLTEKERNIVDVLGEIGDNSSWTNIVFALSQDSAPEQFADLKVPNVRRRATLRSAIGQFNAADMFDDLVTKLAWERHYLGVAVSGHETDPYSADDHCRDIITTIRDIAVNLVIRVEGCRAIRTKTDKDMAFLTGSDDTGYLDNFVVFPETYNRYRKLLQDDAILKIRGRIGDRGGVIINSIKRLR